MMKKKMLNSLKSQCESCLACEIGTRRDKIVFSSGNEHAKVMFIGEAPGKDENLQGIPFVGRAGQLLNTYFERIGIDREKDLYIANILNVAQQILINPTKTEFQHKMRLKIVLAIYINKLRV